MPARTAVVLFNLGGPDSIEAVEPFLFNLFSDPDIFKFPLGRFTQKWFARWIAGRRAGEAAHGYAAIGGKSPLLENTRLQADALQRALDEDGSAYDVRVCMRYWHPLTDRVVAELKATGVTDVILLPLYPQFSLTTTGSSVNEFNRECQKQNFHPRVRLVRAWYDKPTYVEAIAESLQAEIKKLPNPNPDACHVLFSAHGLPQKIVDAGDPYEQHVRATFESVCRKLQWPNTVLCYQSRVGPLKWLQPYTENTIRELAAQGVKQMLVYPIAFVSDHIETLFELGMTYAELARSLGVTQYRVVPALNTHPKLIATLKQLVLSA
jgi:ferrochelatase